MAGERTYRSHECLDTEVNAPIFNYTSNIDSA